MHRSVRRFLLFLVLCPALPPVVGVATAAPHRDIAPLPAEAVAAVRAAQQGRPDPVSAALDRHLREGLELAGRGERVAARFKQKGVKALEVQTTLASRRTEAAAKRQELLGLRDEVLLRSGGRNADALTARGQEAAPVLNFKQQFVTRFDAIAQDLDDLSKADTTNLDARARRAANRIQGWLAARPAEPLPQPNWRRVEPMPSIELPLPGACRALSPTPTG